MTDQVRTMWKGHFEQAAWATSRRATVVIHSVDGRAAATVIGDDGVGHAYDLRAESALDFAAGVKKVLDDAAIHADRSIAIFFDYGQTKAISNRPPPPPPGPPGHPTDNRIASRISHASLRNVVELSGTDYAAVSHGALGEVGKIASAAVGAVASLGNTLASTLGAGVKSE